VKYFKRANRYNKAKKEAARNAPITQRDWGTAAAGVANIGYGLYKVATGTAALFPSAAAAPETAGLSLAGGVYAGYQVASGSARAVRGARQIVALTDDCGSYCGIDDQASRFVIGVTPGGGFLTDYGDIIDKLGSLP
ncbi:MAG: hypothetical protein Q8P61_08935, partial [Candidatus Nanopelagicales bacterium]|nr:hypothetical protein [Candidatus Nanopelagicales bacterium]